MAATEPPGPMACYSGRALLGYVEHRSDGYLASLPNGSAIGIFESMREASRALSTATARQSDV